MPTTRPLAVAAVPPLGDQEYVYGPVPPLGVTVAVPLEPPLHETLVLEVVAVIAVGWVIVTVLVVEYELASVTVTV